MTGLDAPGSPASRAICFQLLDSLQKIDDDRRAREVDPQVTTQAEHPAEPRCRVCRKLECSRRDRLDEAFTYQAVQIALTEPDGFGQLFER